MLLSYRLLNRLTDINYNRTVFMPQQIIFAEISMNEVAFMVHPEKIDRELVIFFKFNSQPRSSLFSALTCAYPCRRLDSFPRVRQTLMLCPSAAERTSWYTNTSRLRQQYVVRIWMPYTVHVYIHLLQTHKLLNINIRHDQKSHTRRFRGSP
jgi:hypothetical protein